ncbi:MAG: YraN family protein [Candidatus Accumulibacter meliphilus]|jgi:putative endonuclease|uniref:YraN family protein n=1 Tax=Candidatus Accumulibacter meliphilus TaxID=2211374 RepID=UPI002FC2BD0C
MTIHRQVNDKDSTAGADERPATPGLLAERLAAAFLERNGLSILARNYRCRGGEVDLICEDRQVLVFVEVRLRRNTAYGGAAASITRAKQGRIILAARHYLASHRARREPECRFDCLLLDALSEAAIEWLRDAFAAA